MAREILIRCDNCKANGITENAEPHTVTVDNMKPRVLDLCATCNQTLLGPVRELLVTYGVDLEKVQPKSQSTASTTGAAVRRHPARHDRINARDDAGKEKLARLGFPVTCLWCPKTLQSPEHTNEHIQRIHDFTSAMDIWGDVCPLCDQQMKRLAMHVTTSHLIDMTEAVRQGAQRKAPGNKLALDILNQRERVEVPA